MEVQGAAGVAVDKPEESVKVIQFVLFADTPRLDDRFNQIVVF